MKLAAVQMQSIHVRRAGEDGFLDDDGEWRLTISVNGVTQTWRDDDVSDGTQHSLTDFEFVVDLPDALSSITVVTAGEEYDNFATGSNDPLPRVQRVHYPGDDWGIGGDFTLEGSNAEASYTVRYRIRDITPDKLATPRRIVDGIAVGEEIKSGGGTLDAVAVVSRQHELLHVGGADSWTVELPAYASGGANRFLQFRGTPAKDNRTAPQSAQRHWTAAVTADRRIALLYKDDRWRTLFPGDLAGSRARFGDRVGLIVYGAEGPDRVTLVATTTAGQLVQIANWRGSPSSPERPDGGLTGWRVEAPLRRMGDDEPLIKLLGSVTSETERRSTGPKHVFAVTRGQRLVWIHDVDGWKATYPGRGLSDEPRLNSAPAAIRARADHDVAVAAITSAGRLSVFESENRSSGWRIRYPVEEAGARDLRFRGNVAADPESRMWTAFAVTREGRLVRIWKDGDQWRMDLPAELAEPNLRFRPVPAVRTLDTTAGAFAIYVPSASGDLVRVWYDRTWRVARPLRG